MALTDKDGRGTYFFWSDWLGSEIRSCSYAAKGLWIDVLANMADEMPPGVITGDLESLAEALGYPGPMVQAWVDAYGGLIQELEAKGVFSRGADVDEDLPPDAIVNRRMYRKWLERVDLSEKRRAAAHVRWDREKGRTPERFSVAEVRAELAGAECKTHAKRCEEDANAMQDEITEPLKTEGEMDMDDENGDAKTCLSPTQPNPTNPNPTQPNGGVGGVFSVGESLGGVRPLDGKSVFQRCIRATRDTGERARWWNHAVLVFLKAGQLHVLDDHVRYIEGKGGGIHAPSRYLVSRVLASARELGLVLRDLPAEGGVA